MQIHRSIRYSIIRFKNKNFTLPKALNYASIGIPTPSYKLSIASKQTRS